MRNRLIVIMVCCLLIVSCQSTSYLETRLDIGMSKEEVLKKMGSPNDVVRDTIGDMYIYYHYDTWAGWKPEWGKKYLLFDPDGKLKRMTGTGYWGTK